MERKRNVLWNLFVSTLYLSAFTFGGGYVIEAASTTKGVIKTQVEGRGWQGGCKIPYID